MILLVGGATMPDARYYPPVSDVETPLSPAEIHALQRRVLQIPRALATLGKKIAGMKTGRDGLRVTRKRIADIKLQVEQDTVTLPEYVTAKNAAARKRILQTELDTNAELREQQEREDSLIGQIDQFEAEYSALHAERRACTATLDSYAAQVLVDQQREQRLTEALATGLNGGIQA